MTALNQHVRLVGHYACRLCIGSTSADGRRAAALVSSRVFPSERLLRAHLALHQPPPPPTDPAPSSAPGSSPGATAPAAAAAAADSAADRKQHQARLRQQQQQQQGPFAVLFESLVARVFSFLAPVDLARLECVSASWRVMCFGALGNELWRALSARALREQRQYTRQWLVRSNPCRSRRRRQVTSNSGDRLLSQSRLLLQCARFCHAGSSCGCCGAQKRTSPSRARPVMLSTSMRHDVFCSLLSSSSGGATGDSAAAAAAPAAAARTPWKHAFVAHIRPFDGRSWWPESNTFARKVHVCA